MKSQLTIDKAGRVVIPKALRDQLHLEAGDTLEMQSAGEQIILKPARTEATQSKEDGVWVFHTGHTVPASVTDDLLQTIREERDLANLGITK